MANDFTIDGTRFQFERLGQDETWKGLELVTQIVGPAFSEFAKLGPEAKPQDINLPAIALALGSSFGKLPTLIKMFAAATKVEHATGPKTKVLLDLTPLVDDVFGGRHQLAILFCAQCIVLEYADFLGGGLENLGEKLGTLLQSLQGQTPSSGG